MNKSFSNIENWILSIVFILSLIGLYTLFLATYTGYSVINEPQNVLSLNVFSQLIAFGIGILFLFFFKRTNYNVFKKHVTLFVIICINIVLLVSLIFFGIEINNSLAWLQLPFGLTIQPSEIFKLSLIIISAYFLSNKNNLTGGKIYLISFCIFLSILIVAVTQNDYGLFLPLVMTILIMYFIANVDSVSLINLVLFFVIAGIGIYFFAPPPHLKNRVDSFFTNIFSDFSYEELQTSAFHTTQNTNTLIGTGLIGKSVIESASLNKSLPEKTTDSIFALFANYNGFLAVLLIFVSYLTMFYYFVLIINNSKTLFGTLLATGITALLATQVLLNLSIIVGFAVTGVPLLFFSKGGTYFIISLISIGILLNIAKDIKK